MRRILVVIDMQNDFIDGSLGTREAEAIVENVKAKISAYPPKAVYATMDTHGKDYLNTQEGQNLPVAHCIKGTEGWKIRPDIAALLKDAKIYEKPTFGSTALAKDLKAAGDIEEIELVGLCTDICVASNALLLKAAMPEVKISVDASCCAGVTPEKHAAALETLRSCQINVTGSHKTEKLVKLSVVFDTHTGNTRQAAEWIAEGMDRAGAQVRCFTLDSVDMDYVRSSCGVVFGSPTYSALMTSDLRSWLQGNAQNLKLGGKLGGAFATQQYSHGGAELVIQSLLELELVYGMVCYSSGGAMGRPVIHIGPIGINGNKEAFSSLDNYREYFGIYGERFAKKAAELFG